MSTVNEPNRLIVHTADGVLRGRSDAGVRSWRGVPYAQPPTGPLRWRAPVAVHAWPGVRDATAFGPVCPQPSNPVIDLGDDAVQHEDCLSLNIWCADDDGPRRPVMVWLHGGAYTYGASRQPLFDASTLVGAGDVVVVTVNYRIGALGFLDLTSVATAAEPFESNVALRDVLLALTWVRTNIAAFGGDRDPTRPR